MPTDTEVLRGIDLASFPGAAVGKGAAVRCLEFEAAGAFTLGDNVIIEAESVYLGAGATIGDNTVVRPIRGRTAVFSMGDQSLIGENSQVMVPHFECGDYTRIFRDALISGYKPTVLGHNCWVGQGAVLNSAETLTIGNNLRMGGSQIWTHVASGELLEGSRFYSEQPVTIEDDVWLMGFGHLVSPGVTLARGTVVMAGSTVSKSTEPYHTYSGIPARDITDKLPAWNKIGADEKWLMLKGFVDEFLETHESARGHVVVADGAAELQAHLKRVEHQLIFAKEVDSLAGISGTRHSVFDLATKKYLKQRHPLEILWQHFATGFRARFIPHVQSTSSGSENRRS